MKLPQCDNSGKASLAQHNNALCHICVGYDKLGAVAQTKHVHLTVPDHDNFRFSESWLSSEAGKIMKEEHRYRFGRRAWALEYKSIHEREVFSKNDPVEFMFVEDVEVQRARALRFGLRDLPSFLNKFSSEDDPEGLREDLDELEFEAECKAVVLLYYSWLQFSFQHQYKSSLFWGTAIMLRQVCKCDLNMFA